jgi:hypothetical protein
VPIPGIDSARQKTINQSGTVDDGFFCATGQEVWNETELPFVKKYLEGAMIEQGLGKNGLSAQGIFEQSAKTTNDQWKSNCKSGLCSLDPFHGTGICGPLSLRLFKNGKSCIDGSTPMSEEEFKAFREEARNKSVVPAFVKEEDTDKNVWKWNKEARALYSKFCKTNHCYYHYHRGSYRCDASSIQPSLLLLTLAILHVP